VLRSVCSVSLRGASRDPDQPHLAAYEDARFATSQASISIKCARDNEPSYYATVGITYITWFISRFSDLQLSNAFIAEIVDG
jgi:hypothetical protein